MFLPAELASEVARRRLERSLGDAHPVVGRPGDARVEVEPDERPAVGHQRERSVGERLERVGRDLQRHRHVRPMSRRGSCRPGTTAGAKPIAWSTPSTRPHLSASAARTASRCSGTVTSSSRTRRRRGSLRAVRSVERQAAAGAREHDLGALLLRELCDAERERRVREHARDHDALAVEKTHGACDRRCGGRTFNQPAQVRSPDVPSCTAAPMRIGILGGTGPAGSGSRRPGWHRSGFEVVIGSRSKYRAMESVDGLIGAVARPGASIDAGGQRGRRRRRPRRASPPRGTARRRPRRQLERHARGKVVISMANALVRVGKEFQPLVPPRGSVAASVQAARAAVAWSRPPSTTCRRRSSATSTTRSRATC